MSLKKKTDVLVRGQSIIYNYFNFFRGGPSMCRKFIYLLSFVLVCSQSIAISLTLFEGELLCVEN